MSKTSEPVSISLDPGWSEIRDGVRRVCERFPNEYWVKLDDVKATFSDGVLEVSVPLPAKPEGNVRKVQIEEPKTAAKSAA